ncbi:MAG TPA: hypothetical protein VFR07_10510 [Mycobacteriales bacterium]|jgi:hypothetical protein|nr:hypothetical protein [Mycobacteriales bacterium]
MTEQQTPGSSAGTVHGRSPSGATSPGTTPADAAPTDVDEGQPDTQVPGQEPGSAASPVPSPGDVPGASLPAVAAGQGASPATGIDQGEKSEGSDATTASPGAFVALAPPGHPDGEVDTRAR